MEYWGEDLAVQKNGASDRSHITGIKDDTPVHDLNTIAITEAQGGGIQVTVDASQRVYNVSTPKRLIHILSNKMSILGDALRGDEAVAQPAANGDHVHE